MFGTEEDDSERMASALTKPEVKKKKRQKKRKGFEKRSKGKEQPLNHKLHNAVKGQKIFKIDTSFPTSVTVGSQLDRSQVFAQQ